MNEVVFLFLIALVAFLYASVGHGGASGYLALMALYGVSPLSMKPSALMMNLAVSLISFFAFYRAGYFKFEKFWPFALASIPAAFIGGNISLSDSLYKKILAICLVISVVRMLYQFRKNDFQSRSISLWGALFAGGLIGLISGMIGIGGGIILSPLMLLMRWATLKETAAVSALFIFVNSLSGLLGFVNSSHGLVFDLNIKLAIGFSVFGGLLGAYFGSQKFNSLVLKYFLAFGLCVASFKLMLT